MKLIATLFFLWFIFSACRSVNAQTATNVQSETKSKISIAEKIKKLDKRRLYSNEYDRFEDRTTVSVNLSLKDETFNFSDIFDKAPVEMYGIEIKGIFFFNGKDLTQNINSIVLRFSAISREWRWLSSNDLIAIVDNERIKLGDGKPISKIRKGGSVYESVSWAVPAATFEKIVNGKSVEIRVGNDEFAIKPNQLKRLKDFFTLTKID